MGARGGFSKKLRLGGEVLSMLVREPRGRAHIPVESVCNLGITYTNTGSRSIEVLLFLRLYEPYRRLLRLFRFNDPATRIPNAVHRRLRTPRSNPTLEMRFSFLRKSRWRTRKLNPLEFSIGSIKRSILRGRQIYEYTISKSWDRTRY